MKRLPDTPHIDHLKRQAKDLLAAARRGDGQALDRMRATKPGLSTDAAAALRLHDAQFALAREYGFASWPELSDFIDLSRARSADRATQLRAFGQFAYAGDIAGGMSNANPSAAARRLEVLTEAGEIEPWVACASGNLAVIERCIAEDAAWLEAPDGPLALPPLVAATHSSLIRLPEYRDGLRDSVDLMLRAGADPNQSVGSRWPPHSVAAPSDEHRLSALYGAAGQNHDPVLTRRLLEAGATPDDGESLYHGLEDRDCLRLLLDAGVTVAGTNALMRSLDFDDFETFKMLLDYGGDQVDLSQALLWAIRRRRSPRHIEALLAAGAEPDAAAADGTSAITQASRFGLPSVVEVLRNAGAQDTPAPAEAFIAACARADAAAARDVLRTQPDLIATLSEAQLRVLPELAAAGARDAVMVMVDLGWPVSVAGGDWNASALNHAVFRGDGGLTRFLLEHGAQWTEEHGFGDNACGTLSFASVDKPEPDGDWLACAQALVAHGMPPAKRNPRDPSSVLVAGVARHFSEEVTDWLLDAGDGSVAIGGPS